ncbi:MAG: 1-hydroxycarotenoid 3,4-desaturase CrtD [Saprospiraceae bacterium]
MKIGIIGAGIGGLAIAVRLASRGHEVTVFEANSYPGGKLSEFSLDANGNTYRFDAGPSLFTMPHYIDELFEIAGEKGAFIYDKQEIVCQYFWDDDTRLTAWADQQKLANEIEEQLGVSKDKVKNILESARIKYNTAGSIFLENSLHKLKTWLSFKVLKSLLLMPRFDIFKSMHATHQSLTGNHAKLTQLLDRFATYNGSNPYKASGMLSVIPHFEHGIGCFYPQGGMYEITKSVYELALRKGVEFHFNQKVEEIAVENGSVKGVKTAEGTRYFDRIVSNMDVYFTYNRLLPREKKPEKTLAQERSTSGLIFYWGIKKSFPELHLHNIFFSDDYKNEFDTLNSGDICSDPTVYVNISSKLTPTDAPVGGENWFVLINAPFNKGQDWAEITQKTRANVLKKLSKVLKTDVKALIEVEDLLDPISIERKTASFAGSLYGTSSNSLMSAFARHPNFSSTIKNLYFVGGSVHPGGGIPLALLSAKIVDELME